MAPLAENQGKMLRGWLLQVDSDVDMLQEIAHGKGGDTDTRGKELQLLGHGAKSGSASA